MTRREVICPFCHAAFSITREACPHCGSDVDTGWRDPGGGIAIGQGNLPDMGEHPAARIRSLRAYRDRKARRWLFWIVAASLLGIWLYASTR